MSTKAFLFGLVLLIVSGGCTSTPSSQPQPASSPESVSESEEVTAGFFSDEQADRGREVFSSVCGECHFTSEFRGGDFEFRWRRRDVWDLYRTVSETMPEDDPGGLSSETYADILAYVLQLNGYAAGLQDLVAEEQVMSEIPLGPGVDKNKPVIGGAR